ncbi:MAG: ABC transporter substrate-binding protein [Tenericutes bacterium HGW-Tenericutes-6]|nr:MAG: ABC transporter substrate-binding protein [Tenericutes bacterium HGW-Tenericutes-6]
MRKIVFLISVLSLGLFLAACTPKQTLKLFMPGEYIDESLVRDFEREHNVRVQIITFDSNEAAIPQIEANSYDLIIPSDYAIEELVSKNLLQEINYSKLENFSLSDLDQGLEGVLNDLDAEGFDLLNYGIPYFWGNVGILYDTNDVTEAFLNEHGWNALADTSYDVMFYDSSRDSFMIALKALGEAASINSPTDQEILNAENWLKAAKGPKTSFLTDEVFDVMLDPAQYDMAVVYSGDGVYLMSENENLGYFVPEEGTNVWVDAFVIPNNAVEVDLAYMFIDYMLSYDVALANAIEIGYTSPRADVITEIVDTEEYPADAYVITLQANDEFFRYNTDLKRKIEEAWVRVRAS